MDGARNDGPGDANGTWVDSVQLVEVGGQKRTFEVSASSPTPAPWPSASSTAAPKASSSPADVQGQFQIVVSTNTSGSLFENGVTANHSRKPADALQPMAFAAAFFDLQIASATVPTAADAGGTISVSFTVINRGPVATDTPHWTGRCLPFGDLYAVGAAPCCWPPCPTRQALGPGEEYQTQSPSLTIPNRYAGQNYIIIVANAGQAVDTYPNTTDNTYTATLNINPYPPADLVASDVVIPTQAFSGDTIPVEFTVTNLGSGPTDVSTWTDTIWLSADKTRPNPSEKGGGGGGATSCWASPTPTPGMPLERG